MLLLLETHDYSTRRNGHHTGHVVHPHETGQEKYETLSAATRGVGELPDEE